MKRKVDPAINMNSILALPYQKYMPCIVVTNFETVVFRTFF